MSRRVIMLDPALAAAPQEILDEARLRFQEIAEGLDGVPEESPFWASVRVSQLCLAVHGWSFFYTVDAEELHVTGLRGR